MNMQGNVYVGVMLYVVCLDVYSAISFFYWCIRKPWSSCIMLYKKIIAHNHHTHNGLY